MISNETGISVKYSTF